MSNEHGNASHWDAYYRSKGVPVLPSQFAVFSLGEFMPQAAIDIGCGSGRDSFYFAQQGIPTVGIDASSSAIALCAQRAAERSLDNMIFEKIDVDSGNLADTALSALDRLSASGSVMLYARFFIHAIDDSSERSTLQGAEKILSERGGIFAVEFRTTKDRSNEKVTPTHFRRFVDPYEFAIRAREVSLHCDYHVEGFGFAKFREDDAHVARFIFSKGEGALQAG